MSARSRTLRPFIGQQIITTYRANLITSCLLLFSCRCLTLILFHRGPNLDMSMGAISLPRRLLFLLYVSPFLFPFTYSGRDIPYLPILSPPSFLLLLLLLLYLPSSPPARRLEKGCKLLQQVRPEVQNYAQYCLCKVCPSDACGGENNGVALTGFFSYGGDCPIELAPMSYYNTILLSSLSYW